MGSLWWHLDSCPLGDTWYGVILWVFELACERALLFGQAKRASRERASEGLRRSLARSPENRFTRPNRRACLQAMFEFHVRALKQSDSVREFYGRASLFVAPYWRAPKRRNSCLRLRPHSVFGSFGVVLMSCKFNFHVVRSALQNSVSLLIN